MTEDALPHTRHGGGGGGARGCHPGAKYPGSSFPRRSRLYCAADVADDNNSVPIQDSFMRTLSQHVIKPQEEAERRLSALGGGEGGGDTLMERSYCSGVKRLPLKEIKYNKIEKTSGGGGGVFVSFYTFIYSFMCGSCCRLNKEEILLKVTEGKIGDTGRSPSAYMSPCSY